MDGLTLLGLITVGALIWLTTYALCRTAHDADLELEAERFFMQMEAFNWPERGES